MSIYPFVQSKYGHVKTVFKVDLENSHTNIPLDLNPFYHKLSEFYFLTQDIISETTTNQQIGIHFLLLMTQIW